MTEEVSPLRSNGKHDITPYSGLWDSKNEIGKSINPAEIINLICIDTLGFPANIVAITESYRAMKPYGLNLDMLRFMISRMSQNGFRKMCFNLFDKAPINPSLNLLLPLHRYFIKDFNKSYLTPMQAHPDYDWRILERVERYGSIDAELLLVNLWAAGCNSLAVRKKKNYLVGVVDINLLNPQRNTAIRIREDIRFANLLTAACEDLVFTNILHK